MPYIGKKPADIIATSVDTDTGAFSGNVTAGGTLGVTGETTLATHLNLGDNDIIKVGAGSDIQIYHDGTYSRIMESGGTALVLDTTSTDIRLTASNSEVMGKFIKDGAAELYHNNSKKLETTSSGFKSTGTGSVSINIGSTNAGGVQIVLDGDSDGDFSGSDYSYIHHNTDGRIDFVQDSPSGTNEIRFYTEAVERLRLTNSAAVFNEAGNNVDFRVEGNSDANLFICDAGNDDVYIHRNNSTINSTNRGTVFNSGDGVSSFKTSADAASDEVAVQFYGTAGKCFIYGNGNVNNDNGTFGNFSDQTLKENIVDAQSQWADIKALQIRNFNLISNPNLTQLGVVAQELEASGMNGLVEELIIDDEKNTKKAVKTSVLYMKAVKALQEAMARIETLEAKVTALEGA